MRPEGGDLFGWGAREAVVRALAGRAEDRRPFGAPADRGDLEPLSTGCPTRADRTAVAAVCFAHGWQVEAWERPGGHGATSCATCHP